MSLSQGQQAGEDSLITPPKAERRCFAIYAITLHGLDIGRRLQAGLPGSDLFVSEKFLAKAPPGSLALKLPFSGQLMEQFCNYDCHIFIVSVGAIVRIIAPMLKSKKVDPAVLCIDDASRFVISLLSGHVGRGNAFTERVAKIIEAQPVITTASDVRGTLTVDILGRDLGWTLDDPDHNVTRGCAAVVNETNVCFVQEAGEPDWWPLDKPLPPGVAYCTDLAAVDPAAYEILLIASDRDLANSHPAHYENAVVYRPKSLVLGLGCDKDTPFELVERGVLTLLRQSGLAASAVAGIVSVDQKKAEPAFLRLSEKYGWPFKTYPADVLDQVEGIEHPSDVVKKYIGTRSVAEAAALLSAEASRLLVAKQTYTEPGAGRNMTLAVARKPYPRRSQEIPHGHA
jgi:cobalt-precorrin 5A hydrolase